MGGVGTEHSVPRQRLLTEEGAPLQCCQTLQSRPCQRRTFNSVTRVRRESAEHAEDQNKEAGDSTP